MEEIMKNKSNKLTKVEIIQIIKKFDTPLNIIFCWAVDNKKETLTYKIHYINMLFKEIMKAL
jgi:hypothetical protein